MRRPLNAATPLVRSAHFPGGAVPVQDQGVAVCGATDRPGVSGGGRGDPGQFGTGYSRAQCPAVAVPMRSRSAFRSGGPPPPTAQAVAAEVAATLARPLPNFPSGGNGLGTRPQ